MLRPMFAQGLCCLAPFALALAVALPTAAQMAIAPPVDGTCPGDRNDIAFIRDDPETGFDLFVVSPDGSNLRHIDNNPRLWDGSPAWSPDHCLIAYEADIHDADHEIRVIRPDGSDMLAVIGAGDEIRDWNPSWSPDGTRIAFARALRQPDGKLGEDDIWVARLDGTPPVQITNLPGDEHWLEWSPTSEQIVFKAEVDGRSQIYVINADGTGLTHISNGPRADGHPTWSPDGRHIAFTTNRTGRVEVNIMDSDGENVRQITHFGAGVPASPAFLAWSPDGRQLVLSLATGVFGAEADLFIMNIDGTGLFNLSAAAFGPGDLARDSWADW